MHIIIDLTCLPGDVNNMMVNAEIWLVRHGESEVNLLDKTRFAGSNIWSELTEKGRDQAIELGRRWSGREFDLWLSSPAIRAQQTCRYCQEGMAKASEGFSGNVWPRYELAFDLVEQSQGDAEGSLKSDYEYGVPEKNGTKFKSLLVGQGDSDWWLAKPFNKTTGLPARGAESQEEVFNRVLNCLLSSIATVSDNNSKHVRIVAFTHETVIKCMCSKLIDGTLPFNKMSIKHTTAVILKYSNDWSFVDIDGEAMLLL